MLALVRRIAHLLCVGNRVDCCYLVAMQAVLRQVQSGSFLGSLWIEDVNFLVVSVLILHQLGQNHSVQHIVLLCQHSVDLSKRLLVAVALPASCLDRIVRVF